MKNLINIMMKIAIIMGAAYLFPEYVVCKDGRTMALAIIVMIIIGIAMELVAVAVATGLVAIRHEFLATAIVIILCLASGVIQLVAAVHYVTGFEIHGRMTYIILALLMGLFSVKDNRKKGE